MRPRNGIHEVRQIEGTLARLDLYAGVGAQTVRELALQAQILRVKRGQAIVRRGEKAGGVFAVLSGSLKTRLQQGSGDEVILGLMGAGATVGLAASVLDCPSRVDLIALEESVLLAVGAGALLAQMRRDARLARNVANDLATKSQLLLTQFERAMLPTQQRLAAYLDSLAEPTQQPEVWTARLPVSKTVVAARLGMKKETLSRLLQRLARRGVIRVARREITILDRARLAEASSDRARGASGRKAAHT
ncbi:MAG TPA: Crp/Fnr family transcriptional regulator [Burkholderiales bacterium]